MRYSYVSHMVPTVSHVEQSYFEIKIFKNAFGFGNTNLKGSFQKGVTCFGSVI